MITETIKTFNLKGNIMDESRANAIENGANMRTGGVNFNYVDTEVLERLGIGRYATKTSNGNNFMRIVTPSSKGAFAIEVWKHSNVGSNKATYLCLDKMFGKRCPVCEHVDELKKDHTDPDVVKELTPSKRYLLFVVDTTSSESEKEGAKWFDCPITIYREICSLSKDRRTGEKIDPTDPENGRDIEFVRVDGKRTTYTGFKLVKTDPIPKHWYVDLPSFEEVLAMPDVVEMEEACSGKKSSSKETDDKDRSYRRESESKSSEPESRERSRDTETREDSRSRRDNSRESRRNSRESIRDSGDGGQSDLVKSKIDEIRQRREERSRND